MKFETLSSTIVYTGRVYSLRKDIVRLPDGKESQLDILEHGGGVAILPVDAQGRILFVTQYRQAVGQELLELPAGTLEAGEEPQLAAHREIREEVGMSAGRLEKLGEFFLAPGYSSERMHVFLAADLQPAPLEQDEDEFLAITTLPAAEAYRLIERGQIPDAKTVLILLLAQERLRQMGAM